MQIIVSLMHSMSLFASEQQFDSIIPTKADTAKVNWLLKQTRAFVFKDPANALNTATEALQLSDKLGFEKGLASANAYLAELYMNYNSGKAEQFQFDAIEHAEKSGDQALLIRIINQTGIFYQTIGQYEKAEPYFRKLYEILVGEGKDSTAAAVLNNLAVGFRYRGMADSSLFYLRKAVNLNKIHGNLLWLSQNYLNIGQYFDKSGNYDSALYYLDKSLKLTTEAGFTRNLSLVHARLGRTYLDANQHSNALHHAHLSLQLGRHSLNRLREREALSLLRDIFRAQGLIDSSFFYLEQLVQLNDSIRADEARQDEKARQLRFELVEQIKNQEIEVLEMKSAHTRKNNLIAFVVLGSLVILLLLAIALFRQRNNLMQKQLDHQKIQLEKEHLLREVDFKNRELATHLLAMQKKNESLLRISDELKKVQLDASDHDTTLRNIVRNLTKTSEEQLWPEFEKRFKEIHGDFNKNLTLRHPDLTANELKLCAFMKMNMSSKEISAITSQSVDTIKMGRYRLRAKLGLQRSDNLVSYLNQI